MPKGRLWADTMKTRKHKCFVVFAQCIAAQDLGGCVDKELCTEGAFSSLFLPIQCLTSLRVPKYE